MALGRYSIIALAAVIIGIAEDAVFGGDSGGLKHNVSVGFFLLAIIGMVAVVFLAAVALTRRLRTRAVRAPASDGVSC